MSWSSRSPRIFRGLFYSPKATRVLELCYNDARAVLRPVIEGGLMSDRVKLFAALVAALAGLWAAILTVVKAIEALADTHT